MTLNKDNLDAIFFDFDGVLADSLKIKADAFLSLFSQDSKQQQSAIEQHFYRYTGRSRQEKFHYIYQNILHRPLSEQKLLQLCSQFTDRSLKAVIDCPEIKGAGRLLHALSDQILCFVVSGTPENELQQIISQRGMAMHFAQTRGTPTQKEINIAQLLEYYQLSPDRCLMLGDGLVDKQAADFNGVPFIGIVAAGHCSPFPKETQIFSDLDAAAAQLIPSE